MPVAEETGAVITHTYEDESEKHYNLCKRHDDELGVSYEIEEGNDLISITPEAWPLIRDKIESWHGKEAS